MTAVNIHPIFYGIYCPEQLLIWALPDNLEIIENLNLDLDYISNVINLNLNILKW